MNKIKLALISLIAVVGVLAVAPQDASAAVCNSAKSCIQQGVNDAGGSNAENQVPLQTRIINVVNVFLFVTGALAVIMIIVGGLRYVISAGNSSSVTGAKNTILYAVVGLVVAILAYALVNFVIKSL